MMLRRVGGVFETMEANAHWTKAWFDRLHSEELIKKLKETGFNCVTTHFHKGFGLRTERQEMNMTKKLVKLCHHYGIRVFAYVQSCSLMHETFFEDVPKAREWIQVDKFGRYRDIESLGGMSQCWRYLPCISQQGYVDYVKRVIHLAITDAHVDGIWLDNLGSDRCYCNTCQKKFKEHLKAKFPEPNELFGIPHFNNVGIPTLSNCRDPIYQEWIRFRCNASAMAVKEWRDCARRLNPDVAVTVNPCMPSPHNFIEDGGVDLNQINKIIDVSLAENGDFPHVENGIMVNQVRGYKIGNNAGAVVLSSSWNLDKEDKLAMPKEPKEVELHMAECAAFGKRCIPATWALRPIEQGKRCFFEREDIFEAVKGYNEFFEKHEDLYRNWESLASVAILHSFPSIVFAFKRVYASVVGYEQVCIQNQVPFEIIFEDDLSKLAKFDVLILADQCCLSDRDIELIKAFVKKGGGLVATGDTSLYDENFRQRYNYGLADIFGVSYNENIKTQDRLFKNGRVIFTPKTDEKVHYDRAGYQHRIPLPKENRRLIGYIEEVSSRGLPLKVKGTKYIAVDIVCYPDKSVAVHLVNYNNSRLVKDVEIRLSPHIGAGKAASLLSPDTKSEKVIRIKKDAKGNVVIRIPVVKTYTVVKLLV